LIFILSPLGDTIFTTPAIRALGESFPKARILILASPTAAKVLGSNPFGMEVRVLQDQWELFQNMALVRKAKYDLVLGLSQLGSLFTRFCGAMRHFDFYNVNGRSDQPVTQMGMEIVRRAGAEPGSSQTEFWLHPWDEADAYERIALFLSSAKYQGAPLIAIHSGGHYFTRKRWQLANFIQVADYLQTETGFQVALIGGQEDIENSQVIQKAVPKVINTTGRFKLAETAVFLKHCRLYLGNDSGPLHLAAAMRTPTLGLFGPTSPGQFYPYHPPFHTFIYKKLFCSPCFKFGGHLWQQIPKCSRAYCMEAITPEEVMGQLFMIDKQLSMNQEQWTIYHEQSTVHGNEPKFGEL
jgi:ADP-heptose:LPS heptosyltransferase